MANVGDEVRDRVNTLLPKVIKKTEEKLGYSLPKVKLTNVVALAAGIYRGDVYQLNYNFYIDGIVSKKDGTLGQLKKLVSITVENVIQGLGYDISQIYYKYKQGDFETLSESIKSVVVERIKQLISNKLEGSHQFTGKYLLPYSSTNDQYVDFIIKYTLNRVSLWKGDGEHCQFEGTIYVDIDDVIVGFEGTDDWDKGNRITDLPSWVEDEFKDSIQSDIDFYGKLCVDVDYKG